MASTPGSQQSIGNNGQAHTRTPPSGRYHRKLTFNGAPRNVMCEPGVDAIQSQGVVTTSYTGGVTAVQSGSVINAVNSVRHNAPHGRAYVFARRQDIRPQEISSSRADVSSFLPRSILGGAAGGPYGKIGTFLFRHRTRGNRQSAEHNSSSALSLRPARSGHCT